MNMKRIGKKGMAVIIAVVLVIICLIAAAVLSGKKSEPDSGQDKGQNAQPKTEQASDRNTDDKKAADSQETREEKEDPVEKALDLARSVDEHVQLLNESAALASNGISAKDMKKLVQQVRDNLDRFESQLKEIDSEQAAGVRQMTEQYLTDTREVCDEFIDALAEDSDKGIKKVKKSIKKLDGRLEEIEKAGK